jgi:hypothetical protein
MSDTTDIRVWLRENHPEVPISTRGPLRNEHRAIYEDEHAEQPPEQVTVTSDVLADELVAEVEVAPERAGESKRTWFSRKVAPKSRPPRAQRRTPIDSIMALTWTVAANVVGTKQELLPVARCLAMQAPAAGMVMDDALKGSFVDKMLQPVARAGKRGEAIWAVAGPPMIVSAITLQPELYPVLRPMLREAVKSWVLIAGPKMRKAAEREAKLMQELDGDFTQIDQMIDSLFAAPPGMEYADASENAAAASA